LKLINQVVNKIAMIAAANTPRIFLKNSLRIIRGKYCRRFGIVQYRIPDLDRINMNYTQYTEGHSMATSPPASVASAQMSSTLTALATKKSDTMLAF
jgi:hypothetical protein